MTMNDHYGAADLRDRVRQALQASRPDQPEFEWSDLAALDQFHVRGLAASRELAARLPLSAHTRVLDIGSGLGGPSRFLAASFGCPVVGIDLNPPYVALASMLAEMTGLQARVSYLHADATELPFADGSFDVAWTQHVAMNIADRDKLYHGIHRVLAPGGSLAMYDVVRGEGEEPVFPLPWAREPAHSFLLSPTAMSDALSRAGFETTHWIDTSDAAIEWFGRQAGVPKAPVLGLQLVMGPDFASMTANLARSLRERRVRLIQAVAVRRGGAQDA